MGYLVISDERLRQAVWRDWPVTLAIGTLAFVGGAVISLSSGELDIEAAPHTLADFVWWSLVATCSWCWTAFVLSIGMRFLNFSNSLLQYSQTAIVPFFVVHQPVIVVISYFVVQWNIGLPPKMLVVVVGSFAVSLGLYQLLIRRVGLLRAAFGMKQRKPYRELARAV
jgi:glucan biosynthesis protein C